MAKQDITILVRSLENAATQIHQAAQAATRLERPKTAALLLATNKRLKKIAERYEPLHKNY